MSKAIQAIKDEMAEHLSNVMACEKALKALGCDDYKPVPYVPTVNAKEEKALKSKVRLAENLANKATKKPARKVQPRKAAAVKRTRKPAAKVPQEDLDHAVNTMRNLAEGPIAPRELRENGVSTQAINVLVAQGAVTKTGAKRGTKYQLAPETKAAE